MTLTSTERKHWQQRIESEIDERVEVLRSEQGPRLSEIHARAYQAAYKALRIEELVARLKENENECEALSQEASELKDKIHSSVLRPTEEPLGYYQARATAKEAIDEQARREEKQLLMKEDFGRSIVTLSQAKQDLIDELWLATSRRQVNDLWQRFLKILTDDASVAN